MVTFLQQTKYTKELEKGTDRKFYDDEETKKQVEKYRTVRCSTQNKQRIYSSTMSNANCMRSSKTVMSCPN